MTEPDYSSRKPLKVGRPVLSARRVPRFGRLEIVLDVSGTYRTPFDPDQIRVDGHFRLPSGREMVVPAFLYRPCRMRREGERSWVEPAGEPTWMLRFAPTEVGRHTVWVTARDRTGEVRSEAASFEATPSASPGFIRVSKSDRRYFEFDNGEPYFAVGENVCTWRRGPADFDRWLPRLGAVGGNYARVWMWAQCFGIEWGRPGQYRLDHAWALDHVVDLAEKHGIRIKLCLEAWRGFGGPRSFVQAGVVHPYWRRNGGPCETEAEFFTNPEARRMFRNRLRYVVARWGYSTHILAWEFWNEINCVRGYRPEAVAAWTAEMARYLKSIDPWGHLVVNSLGEDYAHIVSARDGIREWSGKHVGGFTHSVAAGDFDGLFVCLRSQSRPADFADQFGFNRPVRDEYLKRFGRDIWHEDFDLQRWRNLQGDYLTVFLAELKKQLNRRGLLLAVGAARGNVLGPPLGNVSLQWERWVQQGIVDQLIIDQDSSRCPSMGHDLWPMHRGYGYLQNYIGGLHMNPLEEDLQHIYRPVIQQGDTRLYLARQWHPRAPEKERALLKDACATGLVFSSFRHDNPGPIRRNDWRA